MSKVDFSLKINKNDKELLFDITHKHIFCATWIHGLGSSSYTKEQNLMFSDD